LRERITVDAREKDYRHLDATVVNAVAESQFGIAQTTPSPDAR
jgi:hypothetical protein